MTKRHCGASRGEVGEGLLAVFVLIAAPASGLSKPT